MALTGPFSGLYRATDSIENMESGEILESVYVVKPVSLDDVSSGRFIVVHGEHGVGMSFFVGFKKTDYELKPIPAGGDDWPSNIAFAVNALVEESGRIDRRLMTLESQLHRKRRGSSMLKRMMPVVNLLAVLGLAIATIIKVRE